MAPPVSCKKPSATCHAAAGGGAAPPDATGVHPGVECDKSGMKPIVGMRYNLRGHNYDLCQAEFDKLAEAEKALYDAIPPPAFPPVPGRVRQAGRGREGTV